MMTFSALRIEKMFSGNLYLILSEQIGWEAFPEYAVEFLTEVGGEVLEKGDAVMIRIWKVKIRGHQMRLVFDDYPLGVTLESSDAKGDALVRELYREFGGDALEPKM